MRIELFSYQKCFKGCKKLRPGFTVNGIVWCLTHTRPISANFTEIDRLYINSKHFKTTAGQKIYLTKATKEAVRYNNLPGGELNLDSLMMVKMERLLRCSLKHIFLISFTTTTKHMSELKSMKELLFLNDITLPADQKGFGITEPIVRKADKAEITAPALFAMIQEMDPSQDQAKLAMVAPAVAWLKKATIEAAIALSPAYDETAIVDKIEAISPDQYDTVLLNLKAVLEANPLTDETAMTALVDLTPILGDADLAVFEPVQSIDPEALKALEQSTADAPAEDVPVTDAPANDADIQVDVPADAPSDAPAATAAPIDAPAETAEQAVVVAETAAPALTTRETLMVHARAKSMSKLAGMVGVMAEALKDEADGIAAATAAELPEKVEA